MIKREPGYYAPPTTAPRGHALGHPRWRLGSNFCPPTLVGLTPIISIAPLIYTQQTFTKDRYLIDPMITRYQIGTRLSGTLHDYPFLTYFYILNSLCKFISIHLATQVVLATFKYITLVLNLSYLGRLPSAAGSAAAIPLKVVPVELEVSRSRTRSFQKYQIGRAHV